MSEDFLTYSQELYNTNKENIELSKQYLDFRREYSKYYNLLITYLCKTGIASNKKSQDNKFLELLNHKVYGEKCLEYYKGMIEAQQNYKGLEKCIEAYKNHSISLMSLMKNQQDGEKITALESKYQIISS